MSLPPRFIRNDASFEDWAEGFWYGCVRPDEKTEAIARAAFLGGWEANNTFRAAVARNDGSAALMTPPDPSQTCTNHRTVE